MNWIRIRTDLAYVVEVTQISHLLNVSKAEVAGNLCFFWTFLDTNTRNGQLNATERQIDELTIAGFTTALLIVGWLAGESGNYTVPNYHRYNPQPTKARLAPAPSHQTSPPIESAAPSPTSQAPKRKGRVGGKDPKTGRFAPANQVARVMDQSGGQSMNHTGDLPRKQHL